MINGIMKLFYTEVVKNKMSKLPNGQYEVNDQFKKVQGISIKIDKVLFLVFKILIALVVLFVASKINIYFGIGVFLTEIIYVLYRKSLKPKVVSEIENIKNNINTNGEQILKQKGKKDISFLISILLIGVITHFSLIIILSFCIVLGVTIRDIYLNYKNSI